MTPRHPNECLCCAPYAMLVILLVLTRAIPILPTLYYLGMAGLITVIAVNVIGVSDPVMAAMQ